MRVKPGGAPRTWHGAPSPRTAPSQPSWGGAGSLRFLLLALLGLLPPTLLHAQPSPEPFLLLEVSRDCASDADDTLLADEIRLRMPGTFVVRGRVDATEPDWHVRWRPMPDGTCELAFDGVDSDSAMPLGPDAGAAEIQLAASRVAWLASVSRPRGTEAPEVEPEVAPPNDAAEPSEEDPAPVEPKPEEPPAEEVAEEPPPETPQPPVQEQPSPPPAPEYERIDTRVSVWPGLTLVPLALPERDVASFSFNLLGGRSYGLEGLEIGFLFNRETAFARGVQIALGANVVGGDTLLVQAAVGANVVGGQQRGLALAVGGNFMSDAGGTLVAVGTNVVGGTQNGIALAVGANYGGRMHGLQAAVGANVAGEESAAVQLALGVNAARSLTGFQLGLVNLAGPVEGAQLGLVNIAETTDASIGLVNLMYGEPFYATAWGTTLGGVVGGFRHGGRHLHYSYLAGADFAPGTAGWKLGLGAGLHFPLGPLFLDADLYAFHKVADGYDFSQGSLETQPRMTLGWQPARRFALFFGVGPTILLTGLLDPTQVAPSYGLELTDPASPRKVFVWPELMLGVRI